MRLIGYTIANTAQRLKEKYFQRYIFIHINKTGGSSIEKALGIRHDHKTAMEKRQEYGERLWRKKYSFAFVRNPWDKVVSHYHFRRMTNQTGLDSNNVEFSQWVKLAYDENDPRYYDNPKMFMPQLDWLSDSNGLLLVDDIGRFESLDEDFNKICTKIGAVDCVLPHAKRSKRGDYREYYDSHSIEIVRKCFEKDINYFGYEF